MSKVKTDGQGRLILPDAFLQRWVSLLPPQTGSMNGCGFKISFDAHEGVMKVRTKLFATLCRHFNNAAPGIPFEVELPEGATLADLVNQLKLPREEVKVFFVNGRARPVEWHLELGDEVGVFPLVAGG